MKPITKVVQKTEDLFIEFNQEEMDALGIKPHDKFEVLINEDEGNSIILKKFKKIEIDLSEFDKEILIHLINQSIVDQVPVDEIIRTYLEKVLEKPELEK